jgi:hypothetical protein
VLNTKCSSRYWAAPEPPHEKDGDGVGFVPAPFDRGPPRQIGGGVVTSPTRPRRP